MSFVQKILLWGSQQPWLERQARQREFARKTPDLFDAMRTVVLG